MKNKKAFKIALMSCSAITTFAAIAAVSFNNGANNSLSKLATAGSNWIHYSGYDGGCTGVSIKEYWTNCQGTTVVEDPKGTVSEERKATAADVETITKNYGANDERLFIAGHDLHDNVCSVCHELSMTSNVVDVYSDHGTKGTATLVEDSTYSSSGYGKMYKYVHTYNDYTSKFAITNIFNSTSLDGINKVSFKIVVPEFRLLIAGNDETNYEIYASANSSTLNPVSTIITINRTEGTNDWVMTDSAKLLIKYGGGNIESASLPNRTTFAELFHNFTNWGVSNVYISDILTDKHVCNYVNGTCECGNVIITNSAIGNMSTLTVDTTYSAPTLMGNVNMYKRSGYGSGLFGDYSLEGLNEIKFYVVNEDKGNGFVLNTINGWTDYQGVISGGSAPQVVIATRSGSDWTVTTESGLYLGAAGKLASTAGPSYTVNNATKLTDILNTKSASTSIYVSDIIAKTVKKEVITKDAIATGKIATIGAEKTYTLTESETKVSGFSKVYTYSCSSYFRAMFTDLAIDEFKTIEFYYDGSKSNDQITFKYGDSYFGFHKAAGDVTGYLKATNLGDGSWKITTSGGLLMRLKDTTKVSELTMTGCTKLNELFNVTADGWANTPIEISDILVTK